MVPTVPIKIVPTVPTEVVLIVWIEIVPTVSIEMVPTVPIKTVPIYERRTYETAKSYQTYVERWKWLSQRQTLKTRSQKVAL